jgi:hypothetical protein
VVKLKAKKKKKTDGQQQYHTSSIFSTNTYLRLQLLEHVKMKKKNTDWKRAG